MNWQSLFVPSEGILAIILRGSIMYLVLLVGLRIFVRRHIGSMNLMDLLLMVLIADAAQNGMAGEYHSITEGLLLCGTLLAWNVLFDWLSYRFTFFEKLMEPAPLPVIRNGKFLRRNMRREFLTTDELVSHLREQGVFEVSEVRVAYIEPDGGISFIKIDGDSANKPQASTTLPGTMSK
jgi:uncharacterized membrane protein YcaP (DUF421 family)